MNAYNAVPPFRYQTEKIRYRQTWGAGGQRTVQRPQWSPQPTFQTGRGRYQGPSLPQDPLQSWKSPSLRYEQQNKSWQQYTPFTVQGYNPFSRKQDTQSHKLYYNRPTSLTRRVYRQLKWFKQATLPPGESMFNPQFQQWIDRRTRFWIARHIPWGTLTTPGIPANDPRDTTERVINRGLPCFHWDETLQKKVPCSQKVSLQARTRFKGRNKVSSYQYRGRTNNRRSFYQRGTSTYTRYNRRGSRSYSRF